MSSTSSKRFQHYISTHDPKQVSRHLRTMLIEYVESQLDTGLPEDFNLMLWEINDLFWVLDEAEDEKAKRAVVNQKKRGE